MMNVQMVGADAHIRYCEAFNDCATEELRCFSEVEVIMTMLPEFTKKD